MKALFERYLNEVIGLTIMVLMAVALIAAQADTNVGQAAAERPHDIIEIRLSIED